MRVLIAERWVILRRGLQAVLEAEGHDVVAAVGVADELLLALGEQGPTDVVVLGMLAGSTQADAVRSVLDRAPRTAVLVLGDDLDREAVDDLLVSGALGIVDRLAEDRAVLDGLARVARGERVLSSRIVTAMIRQIGSTAPERAPDHLLTAREREILACLAAGGTNREIAADLLISEATVKSHLASAYSKLGVGNRHQALLRGVELGLVTTNAR